MTLSIQIHWLACQWNQEGGLICAVSNIDVRGLKSVRMAKMSKKARNSFKNNADDLKYKDA